MPVRPPSGRRPGPRGHGWKLRVGSGDDWKVLRAHRQRMWAEIGGSTPRQLAAHGRVYKRWLLPRLASGEVIVLLVEAKNGNVVASGGIWFRDQQPIPKLPQFAVPYLFSMFTEPEFRGRGLAGWIVRESIRISRARGYRRVVLHAAPKGRPVYRRLGFDRAWEMRLDL